MAATPTNPGAGNPSARRRRLWPIIGAVVAIVVITVSCANHYPQFVRPTNGTIIDINSQDPAQLIDGGTLRLPISTMPDSFNPLNAGNYFVDMAKASYPRAFRTAADGALVRDADYFTDVAQTSDNPLSVTYTINPQATWSDGSPVTWEDIDSQVKAMSGADKRFSPSFTTGFDRVESVERGTDDRQAIITFKQPYAEWQGMFAGSSMLLPRSMTATPDAFNSDQPGVSAGPFLVSKIDRTAGRVTLSRNPRWWGKPPRLDSIVFIVLDPFDRLPALNSGTIDAAAITSQYDLATARLDSGFVIRQAPEPCLLDITFNGTPGAALADDQLRLAIAKAIDRETIVNVYLRGLVDNPRPTDTHVVMPARSPETDNGTRAAIYSPDQARAELDELGWKLKDGVREKDGKQLVLKDVYWYDRINWQVAQMVKKDLADVGVTLTIEEDPVNNYLADGTFDLTQLTKCTDVFTVSTMEQYFRTDSQYNFGKIGDGEINDLIARALTEMDQSTSRGHAYQADLWLWDDIPSLPLGQSPGVYAVRNNLANYGAFGLADIDYTAIGFTR